MSSTLENPEWKNSAVLKGDVVSEISKLKQERTGEIVVWASFLMEHDLVDELRLKIYPVVLGGGQATLWRDQRQETHALVGTQTLDGDVVFLTYERVRNA